MLSNMVSSKKSQNKANSALLEQNKLYYICKQEHSYYICFSAFGHIFIIPLGYIKIFRFLWNHNLKVSGMFIKLFLLEIY